MFIGYSHRVCVYRRNEWSTHWAAVCGRGPAPSDDQQTWNNWDDQDWHWTNCWAGRWHLERGGGGGSERGKGERGEGERGEGGCIELIKERGDCSSVSENSNCNLVRTVCHCYLLLHSTWFDMVSLSGIPVLAHTSILPFVYAYSLQTVSQWATLIACLWPVISYCTDFPHSKCYQVC